MRLACPVIGGGGRGDGGGEGEGGVHDVASAFVVFFILFMGFYLDYYFFG